MEEKYSKSREDRPQSAANEIKSAASDGSSSESESEDDDALLATEALDAEISATLHAIRSKDPIVYDKGARFYTEDVADAKPAIKKEDQPMYLRDYHRKNLLEGHTGVGDVEEDSVVPTYVEEQEALKRQIIKEMHAAPVEGEVEERTGFGASDDEEDFMVAKRNPSRQLQTLRKINKTVLVAPSATDEDPDKFLSNFMAARAWIPDPTSRFQPFESDDEEEERRAEEFEEAYNMRFEDPQRANEKLMSHSREAAAKYSVRREDAGGRKRTREAQRAKKDAERTEREQEIARLRRLKIEEAEEKLKKIKKAAALRGKSVSTDEWIQSKFLDADWDDAQWEQEMNKLFGEAYYADHEYDAADGSDDEAVTNDARKGRVKKPKWDDDIDIKDLVPDFEDDDDTGKPAFTLSDDELGADESMHGNGAEGQMYDNATLGRPKSKKDRLLERQNQKREARRERQVIEQMVDDKLEENAALGSESKPSAVFRYRETSPTTFGLTARDILLAEDSQLNQYVGLKKVAPFRDPEKKKKDKKKFSKKARLRQWRKETFGDEQGPRLQTRDLDVRPTAVKPGNAVAQAEANAHLPDGRKKQRRSRKRKALASEA